MWQELADEELDGAVAEVSAHHLCDRPAAVALIGGAVQGESRCVGRNRSHTASRCDPRSQQSLIAAAAAAAGRCRWCKRQPARRPPSVPSLCAETGLWCKSRTPCRSALTPMWPRYTHLSNTYQMRIRISSKLLDCFRAESAGMRQDGTLAPRKLTDPYDKDGRFRDIVRLLPTSRVVLQSGCFRKWMRCVDRVVPRRCTLRSCMLWRTGCSTQPLAAQATTPRPR